MSREFVSALAVLDDTPPAVARIAAPWLGIYWLLLLPLRFFQVRFFREIDELGEASVHYGDHLQGMAWAVFFAFLPALYGRLVYVRACALALQSGRPPGREAWKVPLPQALNALYTTLLCEVASFLLLWSFLAAPLFLLFSGLALVTAHRVERPGLLRPIREIASYLAQPRLLFILLFTFGVQCLAVFINVFMAFLAIGWIAGAIEGWDAARWEQLLRPSIVPIFPAEPLMMYLCLAGTLLIVEPFWLASLSSYVHRSRLQETGEDLMLELRRLQQEAVK